MGLNGGREGPTAQCGERCLTEVTFEWGLEGGGMQRGGVPVGVPGPETVGKCIEGG